ncbi:MAG: pyridoxamine 5'-phosphate oxidase family protein [Pseudonocardiales bacterium]|nr:pyridoxamine 5'-phosphate oxidase family protein [Pseudonocardiales bacterium]
MVTMHKRIPRSTAQRRAAALDMLQNRDRLWLSTGNSSGPHLIPVGFLWDGKHITMATREHSVTTSNIRMNGAARVAIGEPDDLIIVDGTVSIVSIDDIEPEVANAIAGLRHSDTVLPERVCLRLLPTRILVWNGFHEYSNRTVMRNGRWLE